MPMLFDRLVVATHNAGKLAEFQALLQPYAEIIISSGELGLPEPAETGDSFRANARLKAAAAQAATGSAALADDSGLCIAALRGEPGIHSARFAQQPNGAKDFPAAMAKVHGMIGNSADRSAFFTCALCLIGADGQTTEVEGRLAGSIVWPPRGSAGHGYDPFFQPLGSSLTLAEMSAEAKNAISHRGVALGKLIEQLGPAKTNQPDQDARSA